MFYNIKKISFVAVFAFLSFFSSVALAEAWLAGAGAAAEVASGAKVDAEVNDFGSPDGDALVQNCAGAACAQIAGDPSKINVGLAAARITGTVEAKVTSASEASGESVTQNCAAAACAQVGQAGGSW